MTSSALASSICTPRKMMRSSKSLVYGLWMRSPLALRSRNSGQDVAALGRGEVVHLASPLPLAALASGASAAVL